MTHWSWFCALSIRGLPLSFRRELHAWLIWHAFLRMSPADIEIGERHTYDGLQSIYGPLPDSRNKDLVHCKPSCWRLCSKS